ncbi:hypothetical protein EUX98_g1986 [Antrodiella citrinella]|uniref:Uncharacterized protein n=1 Tax=Antrodiella citrinella TaxID=2447956 RepID=A0A4S4N330_9APHY|nr:hypothetical protein EUX98_g1986 [Antrodiella citrinella]
MYILMQNRSRRRLNRTMITVSFSLISLATAEFIVNIVRLQDGFLSSGPKHLDGIEGFFADISEETYILKSALYNVQTLILDAVVIYRARVVWKNWWVLLIPIFGWCLLLASIAGLNYSLAAAAPNTDSVFDPHTKGWIILVYATTLATNVLATALLAYRIWRVNRRAAEFVSSDRLAIILRVVIESGIIYSVTIFIALCLFITGSRAVYVMVDLISPIISIVFNLIVVRVGFATKVGLPMLAGLDSQILHPDAEFTATIGTASRAPPAFRAGRTRENGVEMKSLELEVDLTDRNVTGSNRTSINEEDVKDGLGTAGSKAALRIL